MDSTNLLNDYMAEMVEIMQEMQAKIQRVKEIKTEIEKIKNITIKTTTTTTNIKIDCECGCKINKSSWYKHIKTKKHLNILNKKSEVEKIPKVEKIQKNKKCLDLYVKPKYEKLEKVENTDDDEDYKNEVDDNEVDKVLNKIKEMFYKGLYVRHYENQNLLDISIRTEIHKHFNTYKDYKLLDRDINNILNEHSETYPIKKNELTKSKDDILDQILKAKLWNGIPVNYCISNKDMKHFKRVILNDVYCEYADMMNTYKPMELVRDSYKLSVVKAFKEHRENYGIDKEKIDEYIILNNQM